MRNIFLLVRPHLRKGVQLNLRFNLTATGKKIWQAMVDEYPDFLIQIGNKMDSLTVKLPDGQIINYTSLLSGILDV